MTTIEWQPSSKGGDILIEGQWIEGWRYLLAQAILDPDGYRRVLRSTADAPEIFRQHDILIMVEELSGAGVFPYVESYDQAQLAHCAESLRLICEAVAVERGIVLDGSKTRQ